MALPKSLEGKLRIPLIGAPMFIVSGPELVIAQCQAGIIGGFPALNARPQSALADWLKQIEESLAEYAEKNPDQPVAPYAVNQIVHASNSRLLDDMATCVEHKVPIIITSLRPPADVVANRRDIPLATDADGLFAGSKMNARSFREPSPLMSDATIGV